MKNNSKHLALGEQCSAKQRLTEQPTRKELILKSPYCDVAQMYDMRNLPEHIMDKIKAKGLYDKWKCIPKMLWSAPKHGDTVEHLLSFINRHGTVNTRIGEMMKPMTLQFKH